MITRTTDHTRTVVAILLGSTRRELRRLGAKGRKSPAETSRVAELEARAAVLEEVVEAAAELASIHGTDGSVMRDTATRGMRGLDAAIERASGQPDDAAVAAAAADAVQESRAAESPNGAAAAPVQDALDGPARLAAAGRRTRAFGTTPDAAGQ